ncbi:MAG TPA: two-component regulator propeller domain-containing protein [Bacteroidales bacterium]
MRTIFLFLLFFVFSLVKTWGQQYNFLNYSVGDGLPQSQIYAIHEDSRGYLWFGSYGGGISCFDGINFTNYSEEDGLQSNFIRCISEDNHGNLWIGTDNGLSKFDGRKFASFTEGGFPKNAIVISILCDNTQTVWIGTQEDGLFAYAEGKLRHFTTKEGLANNTVNCLFRDREGAVWAGTENGANKITRNGIVRFTAKEGFPFNSVRSIAEDKTGNIWFSSYGGGVCFFNGSSFTRYTSKDGLCSNTVFAICCDSKGYLWFGTAFGVSRYDGNTFKTYTDKEGLCGNVVVTITEDSFHNIWFGSSGGGVGRLDNERFVHFTENNELGKWVYAIAQDKQGKFWMGTSAGGVTRYDGKAFQLFKEDQGFTAEKVKAVFCDNDGDLWLGTLGKGVYRYNGKSFVQYTTSQGLCGNFITSISADSSGNIWFASLDRGIGYFRKANNKFYHIREKDGLADNRVNVICPDSHGNIWAGLADAGLSRISFTDSGRTVLFIKTFTRKQGLTSHNIRSLVYRKENLFIGTSGGGINILHADGRISVISKKNGLSSNNIYSLLFDKPDNLWVGTEKGIDKIILNNDSVLQVIHYGKPEGFISIETNQNAICQDTSGCIWFGTVNGAVRYNPAVDFKSAMPPKVHINNMSLFFDKIENTPYAGNSSHWSHLPNQLILPHNKNHLSFEFIGIDFKNPQAVRYKWKLDGFDKDWSPALQKREATYSNLPPGKYIFQVKACNEEGIWTSTPAEFRFAIKPPFWSLFWFQAAFVLIIILVGWLIIRNQLHRIKQRTKDEKQRLELERNILELERATGRLQMNPHFVFNSLNSIQGYITNNDKAQAKWYLSKFAKLMRLILDNAREEFIPLKDEIEILENYLILEKLRRNDKFEFTITVDDGIDTEAVEIPPMIVQPFAENAVLHGIKNKEGKGNIRVNFKMTERTLICEITDDGIGRDKARELKNISSAEHRSSAIAITEERLKQLGRDLNQDAGVNITDLKDGQGNACGTKVIMKVPI